MGEIVFYDSRPGSDGPDGLMAQLKIGLVGLDRGQVEKVDQECCERLTVLPRGSHGEG